MAKATDRSAGNPSARHSDMTGLEFLARLDAAGWNRSDFARLAGVTRVTADNYVFGKSPIPVLVQLAVEYIERFPLELLARPEVQTPKRQSPGRRIAAAVAGRGREQEVDLAHG
jgi:hypothetical protein